MKNKFALFVFMLALGFSACKKENDSACDGGNLCFTLNGEDISVTAERRELPNGRYRLYWEETTGALYKNVEIDIYGNTPAEYTFTDNSGSNGDAAFQYFVNDGGTSTNYVGLSGTLSLSSVDGGEWSGTFSGTVNDGTNSFDLTNGKFSNVPLE